MIHTRELAALSLTFLLAGGGLPAHAEFRVDSPIVEEGEVEVEHAGSISTDPKKDKSNAQSFVTAVGYGVTSHWFTEIEGEWSRDAGDGNDRHFDVLTWKNRFQFFPQGEKWLDVGLLAEYGAAGQRGDADRVKFGPLLQKDFGPVTTTVNLLLEKEIGANATGGAEFTYATQVRWDLYDMFSPALEVYGDLGEINSTHSLGNQEHRMGPVATGKFSFGELGELKYEAGYLRGLTNATSNNTYKWLLEYEHAL